MCFSVPTRRINQIKPFSRNSLDLHHRPGETAKLDEYSNSIIIREVTKTMCRNEKRRLCVLSENKYINHNYLNYSTIPPGSYKIKYNSRWKNYIANYNRKIRTLLK